MHNFLQEVETALAQDVDGPPLGKEGDCQCPRDASCALGADLAAPTPAEMKPAPDLKVHPMFLTQGQGGKACCCDSKAAAAS